MLLKDDCESSKELYSLRQAAVVNCYPAYIGLDVHEETIVVSVARSGREAPESRGEIANKPGKVSKLVERVKTDRRDAGKLSQAPCSGDLAAVWAPDEEREAMR